jgi:hypothetical protein
MSRRSQTSCDLKCLILASLALSGCAAGDTHWQEEVQLTNGSVMVVSRHVLYENGGGEWGRDSGKLAIGERLTFTHPLLGTEVTWTDPHRIASVIDVIDGTVWVVARQRVCRPEDRAKRFWRAFALRADGWIPATPEDAPAITTPNLALDSADYVQTSHWRFLSISLKHALDDASRVDPRMRDIRWQSEWDCQVM